MTYSCICCIFFIFTEVDVDEQINAIAAKIGVSTQTLDQPCADPLLLPISQRLVHWSSYAEYLGLTPVEILDIQTNVRLTAPNSKGLEMLHKWIRACTDKATYRCLLRGCVNIHRDLQVAEEICRLLLELSQ